MRWESRGDEERRGRKEMSEWEQDRKGEVNKDTKEQRYFCCQRHSVKPTVVSPSVWSP